MAPTPKLRKSRPSKRNRSSRVMRKVALNRVEKQRQEKQDTQEMAKNILESIINEVEKLVFVENLPSSDIPSDTHEGVDSGSSSEYDFTWGDLEEYEQVMKHELCIEKEKSPEEEADYRIVDINFCLKKMIRLQANHAQKCTGGILDIAGEDRKGLVSVFTLKCLMCQKQFLLQTENPSKKILNKAVVWGTLATGGSYEHTYELLSTLNIPGPTKKMFYKIQRELGPIYKDCLWESMEEAGREEHQLAVERGNVDENGIAEITVITDGGWSKRSFGHTYNALSGVAVIIGKETGKLLFLGVRNKYCSICSRDAAKGDGQIRQHVCFKNWTTSSGAMEPSIIVEGFNNSIEMHKLRYMKFIADGDSTVYAQIRAKVPYGHLVEKAECTNHCLKNYGKNLYKIKHDTKGIPLAIRNMLSAEKIKQLQKRAQDAIYANTKGNVEKLKRDIANSVAHVFGHHLRCDESLCDKVGDITDDKTALLQETGAHHHIYGALNLLIAKAHLLVDRETSNLAELYMSILARFNMGKRLNLVGRDSFQIRSCLSGLKFNHSHSWHARAWKKAFQSTPGKHLQTFSEKREQMKLKRHAREGKCHPRPKKMKFPKSNDKEENDDASYGPNISALEVPDEELHQEVNQLVERLQVTQISRDKIEKETIGQFDNVKFINERRHRLTASNFGAVIKRTDISCHNLVKQILHQKAFTTAATNFGKVNEAVAKRKFQTVRNGEEISDCGIFVDLENGFLAASPDGIIGNELIEVKCLFSVSKSKENIITAAKGKKINFLKFDEDKGTLQIVRNHNYYFQIQGQLNICKKNLCNLIVYAGEQNPMEVLQVHKDTVFWETTMLPKLKQFYVECIAPEIILGRIGRKLQCRDPPYLEAAIARRQQQKQQKSKPGPKL